MKTIKFILVVMMSLTVSFEAFAKYDEKSAPQVREEVEMEGAELNVVLDPTEGAFAEDVSIDISSQDLENTLKDAYAVR